MKTKVMVSNLELSFTDSDIVDIEDVGTAEDYNPHNERLWLLHDHGFTICVVKANCLQDALDIAVDNDKLDRYLINLDNQSDRDDYLTDEFPTDQGYDEDCPDWIDPKTEKKYWFENEPARLGNASEPFDIDTLGYVEFPLPKLSIVKLFGEKIDVDPKNAFFA